MRKLFLLIVFNSILFNSILGCNARIPVEAPDEAQQPVGSARLAGLLGADAADGFPRALDIRAFEFPDDHGPHPDYRNEWWYVTGNLRGPGGERFGYELTLFRFALTPTATIPANNGGLPGGRSGWRSSQIYVGHFAVTDPQSGEFRAAERYARGALGLAGARARPFRVWLDDWEIATADDTPDSRGGRFRLRAAAEGFSIAVELTSLKAPVLNGDRGLSRKSAEPGNASYYYSMTRLDTVGSLRIEDREFDVSGDSWLDREWGSSALAADQSGWDWFALQLADGTELMFYSIRSDDGTVDPQSAGTFTAADGRAVPLGRDDVRIRVLDYWTSPLGGRYPARWQLGVSSLGLDVVVVPVLDDQELSTAVRYWEGAVDVAGTRDGRSVDGYGYVELTGYAE